jgi:hypothetical protein
MWGNGKGVCADALLVFSSQKRLGPLQVKRSMSAKPPGPIMMVAFQCVRAAVVTDFLVRVLVNFAARCIAARKIEVFSWTVDDAASAIAIPLAIIMIVFAGVFSVHAQRRLSIQAVVLFTVSVLCTVELARY